MRPCADENSWTSIDSPLCALPQEERDSVRARLEAFSWRASFKDGCTLTYSALKPVPTDQRLDVQLSSETGPKRVQLF